MKKLIAGVVVLLVIGLGVGYYLTDGEFLQGKFFTRIGLDVSAAADTPDTDILIAGENDIEVAKFKFASSDSKTELNITNMVFSTNAAAASSISKLTVEYEDQDGSSHADDAVFVSGEATFPDMDFYLPANDNAYLTVYADLNTISSGMASAGDKFVITLDSFEGINMVAGDTLARNVGAKGNAMYVYETKPAVELASSSPSGTRTVSTTDQPFILSVTNEGNEDLTIRELTINLASDGDFNTSIGTLETSGPSRSPSSKPSMSVSKVTAYLKMDGTTYASADVDLDSSSKATITFDDFDIDLEIAGRNTENLVLQVDTSSLIDADTGIDDPVTFSVNFGTASSAGDIVWYETNEEVSWIGDTSSSSLTSTLVY